MVDAENNHVAADVRVGECLFRQGRLWIEVVTDGLKGVIYGVDLKTSQAEIIDLPMDAPKDDSGYSPYSTGNSFEIIGDNLFFNRGGGVQRYSMRSKKWEDLPVPESGELTVVEGKLFIVNKNSILELNEDGKETKVLASTRRRPAINVLDTLGNYAHLLPGPDGLLRAIIGGKVYDQIKGSDGWTLTADASTNNPSIPARIPDEGFVLASASPDGAIAWQMIPRNGTSLETVLYEPAYFKNLRTILPGAPLRSRKPSPLSHWNHPRDIPLFNSPMVLDDGNLWFFYGDLTLEVIASGKPRFMEESGRHALLVEFRKDSPEASIVPLWFGLKEGAFTPEALANMLGVISGDGKVQTHPVGARTFNLTPDGIVVTAARIPGFWLIPWTDIEPRMEALVQQQAAAEKARLDTQEQHWAELLQKYHLDHREKFTPEEKEAMIDDPLFLELEMPQIDTNHNGRIDAEELAFFDANQDGVLDPKELDGLNQAWSLLAAQIMKEIDRNGDGELDPSELQAYAQSVDESRISFVQSLISLGRGPMVRPGQGITLDSIIDLERNQTLASLSYPDARGRGPIRGMRGPIRGPGRPGLPDIKALVEDYWKKQRDTAAAAPDTTNSPK